MTAREGGVHLVRKRVFAAQPFLNLSQFLEELPIQAAAAGARNNRAPSQFFVKHNGERRCGMRSQFLSQCFRYQPNNSVAEALLAILKIPPPLASFYC
jgi:hypothetical protein